jgi:hypothetical protein
MPDNGRVEDIQLVNGTCYNYKCQSKGDCTRYKGDVDPDTDIKTARMVYVLTSCKWYKPKKEETGLDPVYGDLPIQ